MSAPRRLRALLGAIGALRFSDILKGVPRPVRCASFFVIAAALASVSLLAAGQRAVPEQTSSPQQTAQPSQPAAQTQPPATPPSSPAQTSPGPQRVPLSVVILDPAHGGTDPGARGVGGVRESDLVLSFSGLVRTELEKQGLRVVLTRDGNDNPSLDDRAARANAQRGAIFISLHVGSTGLEGTARVYALPDMGPLPAEPHGLIPWDRAQAPLLDLSRKLADLAQGQLAQRFKGSPNSALTASVRQLRTVAAPAIAIELSSVAMEDQADLNRMGPGLAECIARAVAAFRAVYDASPTAAFGERR